MTVTIEAFEVWKRPYEMDTDDPFDALRLFFGGQGRPVTAAAVFCESANQGISAADLLAEYPDVFQQVMTHGIVDEPTDELPGVAAINRGGVPRAELVSQRSVNLLSAGWTVRWLDRDVPIEWRSPRGASGSDYRSHSLDIPPAAVLADARVHGDLP